MPEHRAERAHSGPGERRAGRKISAGLLTALAVVIPTAVGIGARYWVRGDFDIIHAILILFFSANLLVCYWEVCLLFRRDYIEERAEYWRQSQYESGRAVAVEFFATKIPLTRILSSTVWADVWAAYSQYDDSYVDQRTYGYNVDIANGLITPVPTLILYVAFTFDFLPAVVAGIIGMMLFWQFAYATSVYWASFFLADRQNRIGKRDMYIYIWALNSPWVLFALLGLYVSICLVVNGDYSVLGY